MTRWLAALSILLVLTAAACGDDGESEPRTETIGTTSPSPTPASALATAGPPFLTATPTTAAPPAAAPAQTSTADPCRIVTKEELEAALGFPLRAGERGTGPIGEAQCAYKAQFNESPGTMPDVIVAIWRSRLAGTTYDGLRESASSRATDVPGLGDKAYVFIGGSMPDNREIQVLKGDTLFSINLTAILNPPVSMSEEEKKTKLIALARTALGRL